MQIVMCAKRAAAFSLWILVPLWTGFFCVSIQASAQTSLDDIHVTPMVAPKVDAANPLPHAAVTAIRKNVDLVLVPVTVTDTMNRLVTGLNERDFQLFEEKRPQEIQHFSSEDAPVSIGIVLDLSSSMSDRIEWARKAVLEFCRAANPEDEFFLVTFADKPELVADFTSHIEDLQAQMGLATAHGRTSLLDAIYLSMSHMRKAKYQKRALLIISDGGDNRSRYTLHEIKSMVKESDTLIYGIGIYDPTMPTMEQTFGPELLDGISRSTGGRSFPIVSPELLPVVSAMIGTELRNQYVLAYRPADNSHNGKWHKIQVKLRLPKTKAPLFVRAKMGYYAPAQ